MADGRIVKRILKELQGLVKQPEDGIRVIINEENLADIVVEYDGPEDTPFAGGLFKLRLTLDGDYPMTPPKGHFITKIFHPNISKSGEVCVNVLKKDWNQDLELRHVLKVIQCLLIQPFPDSALNEEAGRLLLENYDDYAKHARLITSIHAQPPRKVMPLSASAGANAINSKDHDQNHDLNALKKPKGVEKSKQSAAKKRSIKRL